MIKIHNYRLQVHPSQGDKSGSDMSSPRSPASPASPTSSRLDSGEDWTGTGSSIDSYYLDHMRKLHEKKYLPMVSTSSRLPLIVQEEEYMSLTPLTRNQDTEYHVPHGAQESKAQTHMSSNGVPSHSPTQFRRDSHTLYM